MTKSKPKPDKKTQWVVYVLKCADDTLYTGITNNLEKRLDAHNSGTGAKYTRGRSPVKLAYVENCKNRADASKREHAVKSLSRAEKEKLIGKIN